MRQATRVVLVIAVLGILAAGVLSYEKLNTSRSAVADDKTVLADVKHADPAAVQRGEYVMRAADCAACHTAGKGNFAGDYVLATPFGTLLSSNITPDRDTGIGAMTERDFFNAVRHGRGSKGFLYPAMPYDSYARLNDQDMHDLWSYMSTVTPVRNEVDENAGMHFPYNLRIAMAGWNVLFYSNAPFEPTPGLSPPLQRGQYLVDGAGHCAACHSPRNALGAVRSGAYLQGAKLGEWYAPDLTSNAHVGLGNVAAAQISTYLHTGGNTTSMASGPMSEAVVNSLQYLKADDLAAISAYLKQLPPSSQGAADAVASSTPAMQRGALRYEVNCSACHGLRGEGMGAMTAPFAGNPSLQSDDATTLIHLMLTGGRAPATREKPTGAGMPSFGWKMDDRQIAETLDFIRNSWGNRAAPVRASDVKQLRIQLEAGQSLPAN